MTDRHEEPSLTSASLVAAVAVVIAACGGGSDKGVSPTLTKPRMPVTAPVTVTAADPLDGYRAYWDAYLDAADPMDPQNPVLAKHATGPALDAVRRSFLVLSSTGRVIRGDLDLAPRLVATEGDTATVRDCYADGTGLYDAATGDRQDEPSGQRHLVTATMLREGGTWKVERLSDEGLGCTAS